MPEDILCRLGGWRSVLRKRAFRTFLLWCASSFIHCGTAVQNKTADSINTTRGTEKHVDHHHHQQQHKQQQSNINDDNFTDAESVQLAAAQIRW